MYENCDKPTESSEFYQIQAESSAGGQDWSSLAGKVLCSSCYQRYQRSGTLERTYKRPPTQTARRCFYDLCEKPEESSKFYRIQQGKTSGGQDWSHLAGKVLCKVCYKQFQRTGSLERSKDRPLPAATKRCSYAQCDRPDNSPDFWVIQEGSTAGGQDWSSITGRVLCSACYQRFQRSGSLEKPKTRPVGNSQRRCSYEHCDKPEDGCDFYQIQEESSAGGQDWTSLTGRILCSSCYQRYRRSGSLERTYNRPLSATQKRCMYANCDKPEESSEFYQIQAESSAGGQDWSQLAGKVLCSSCYQRYQRSGTLERSYNKPLLAANKRCSYELCERPDKSCDFYQIQADSTAGGQDWTPHAGKVLCSSCYQRYRASGNLEKTRNNRCTYEHCAKPDESSKFYKIQEGKTAGGQDWSSLVGQVLCNTCFARFMRSGQLERQQSNPNKKQKIAAAPGSIPSAPAASSSTSLPPPPTPVVPTPSPAAQTAAAAAALTAAAAANSAAAAAASDAKTVSAVAPKPIS